jgi:hypothetical protein
MFSKISAYEEAQKGRCITRLVRSLLHPSRTARSTGERQWQDLSRRVSRETQPRAKAAPKIVLMLTHSVSPVWE